MSEQICWFCGKNTASPAAAIEVPLHRDDAVVEQVSRKKTRVTWTQKTIIVPSCTRCKRASSLGCVSKILTVVLAVAAGGIVMMILRGLAILPDPAITTLLGVLSSVLAGYGIIRVTRLLIARYVGNEGWDKDQREYPAVKAAVEEGWEVGFPPDAM